MKLLVFGKSGQVAQELARLQTDHELQFLSREDVNLSYPMDTFVAIREAEPEAVLNAAAFTNVDGAEGNMNEAVKVNGEAPGAMARACANLDIPLVHVSTDYVFDGTGNRPWTPSDKPAPLGAYGRSKLIGEVQIRASGAQHVILRTSWVFSAHGSNFVKTMLRLSESQDHLRIVADQIGGPTAASDIAGAMVDVAEQMVDGAKGGTYHFSATPAVSWADFARAIFRLVGRRVQVEDIATADYPSKASRPLNSRLDCTSLLADFAIAQPEWEPALAAVRSELEAEA